MEENTKSKLDLLLKSEIKQAKIFNKAFIDSAKLKEAKKVTDKMGITINEVAFALSIMAGISFESARNQVESILNAFSQPTCQEASEKLSEIIGRKADGWKPIDK